VFKAILCPVPTEQNVQIRNGPSVNDLGNRGSYVSSKDEYQRLINVWRCLLDHQLFRCSKASHQEFRLMIPQFVHDQARRFVRVMD
jgi:hypothetical protein